MTNTTAANSDAVDILRTFPSDSHYLLSARYGREKADQDFDSRLSDAGKICIWDMRYFSSPVNTITPQWPLKGCETHPVKRATISTIYSEKFPHRVRLLALDPSEPRTELFSYALDARGPIVNKHDDESPKSERRPQQESSGSLRQGYLQGPLAGPATLAGGAAGIEAIAWSATGQSVLAMRCDGWLSRMRFGGRPVLSWSPCGSLTSVDNPVPATKVGQRPWSQAVRADVNNVLLARARSGQYGAAPGSTFLDYAACLTKDDNEFDVQEESDDDGENQEDDGIQDFEIYRKLLIICTFLFVLTTRIAGLGTVSPPHLVFVDSHPVSMLMSFLLPSCHLALHHKFNDLKVCKSVWPITHPIFFTLFFVLWYAIGLCGEVGHEVKWKIASAKNHVNKQKVLVDYFIFSFVFHC